MMDSSILENDFDQQIDDAFQDYQQCTTDQEATESIENGQGSVEGDDFQAYAADESE